MKHIKTTKKTHTLALTIMAIGVVFGDIGTSPLYAMKEAFSLKYDILPTEINVLGILSLIFWSLIIVVSIKYVFFMLSANNKGEGGMIALLALTLRSTKGIVKKKILTVLGIFGAALFFGDGMITPAISVLSAVEGLEVATPVLKPYVIPFTLIIIFFLFVIQKKGTSVVGKLFGPITLIWFFTLGSLGVLNIVEHLSVLKAINPYFAFNFFFENKSVGFLCIGAIVLAITGTEGIYTDMGHFGEKPIRIAWSVVVLPALLLNYFGQGALILNNEASLSHPFYNMVPNWALYPVILLATLATIIASQAVISGTFSLTRQAIQLGYCPRMTVIHTSEKEKGQIYLPWINWFLMISVITLVMIFKSSENLAGIYGVAVTGMMVIDTILVFFVVTYLWKLPKIFIMPILIIFFILDLTLFGATSLKMIKGGWMPILIAIIVFTLFTTWKNGRAIIAKKILPNGLKLNTFISSLKLHEPKRVSGTAIFLTRAPSAVPHALLHNLNHNKILHDKVILLNVKILDIPHVIKKNYELKYLDLNFFSLQIKFGYKDTTDIPQALEKIKANEFQFNIMETSFFLSKQTLIPKLGKEMPIWREKIFAIMARNATNATDYFKIPANRVVELGSRIEF